MNMIYGREDKTTLAYEKIKHHIVRDLSMVETPPVLSEAYFVEMFSISRTPVRAALQRLEQEGFLYIVPKQGIMLRELSLEDSIQLLDLRAALERFMIEKSIGLLNEDDILHLREIIKKMNDAVSANDYAMYLELDEAFHNYCYHHYKNQYMMNSIQNYRERFYSNRYRQVQKPGRAQKSILEHEQILDALHQRDLPVAAQMLTAHTLNIRNMMMNQFAERKSLQF